MAPTIVYKGSTKVQETFEELFDWNEAYDHSDVPRKDYLLDGELVGWFNVETQEGFLI